MVFMIFAKTEMEGPDATWNSYTDRHFPNEEAARDYIENYLEPMDKELGIYEPDYYRAIDMTEYYK